MSSFAFWIVCLASAGAAFAMVYVNGSRLVTAMVVGTAAGFLMSLIILWLMSSDEVGHWFDVQLALNGSVGLIFAGVGAGIGYALRHRRG